MLWMHVEHCRPFASRLMLIVSFFSTSLSNLYQYSRA